MLGNSYDISDNTLICFLGESKKISLTHLYSEQENIQELVNLVAA